jgi:hypothetical protein
VFVTPTIQHSSAQIPIENLTLTQSQSRSQQLQKTLTSFVTFKDPERRFSMNFPSNWTATAATNRFEKTLVTFTPRDGITIYAFS